MFDELTNKFRLLNDSLHVKLGHRDALQKKLKSSEDRLKQIERENDLIAKTSLFLQSLSDTTRQLSIDKISAIVTDALQKVKDPDLEFKMLLSTERGQSDLKFVVYDKITNKEYDILTSCGGGVADIVSFPLRIALLLKWNPELSKVLILDEAFKFVSVTDQELLADFVRQISEKLGVQLILVTHSSVLSNKANKVFSITKKGSQSIVESNG